MEKYINENLNISIKAESLNIGKHVTFGKNINVNLKGAFEIGDFSRLGDNTTIKGRNVKFGKHLYNSNGLNIGGGGYQHPNANLVIGDRCTIHNNFINICEPVTIGNDVGLSPDTSILTHGYWLSVLEGYPMIYKGVEIGNEVIIGYRSLVMMGVTIANGCVIGAGSTVSKPLNVKGIYAGVPAKFIREIILPTIDEKIKKMSDMVTAYSEIAKYHDLNPEVKLNYPLIIINEFTINVETFEYSGTEDYVTDDFRDYVRKWGIRIYTERPFINNYKTY